jgi:hypothetical protein
MKKRGSVALILIIVLSVFGLTGCFNGGVDEAVPDIIVPNNGADHSPQEEPKDIKIDTGTYVGQIDSNSIEINISGVPEDMASRALRFSPELKDVFEQLGIQDNTPVKFEYYVNSQEQWVLVKIDPM